MHHIHGLVHHLGALIALPRRSDSLQEVVQFRSMKEQVLSLQHVWMQSPQAHAKSNVPHDPPSHEVPP